MKVRTLLDIAQASCRNPRAIFGPKQYLFLLSHMRSYSSLLAHILGSHPDIVGHSERLRSYADSRDLVMLRLRQYQSGGPTNYTYLLDKILHDRYAVADKIMGMRNVRAIIFVREPAATFRSIVYMGQELLRDESYCDLDRVLEYYTRRLDTLVAYCQLVRTPALFFEADNIVHNTERLINVIGDWLQLRTPLTSNYKVFPETGQPGRGDPSDKLRQGTVVSGSTGDYGDIDIPPAILTPAQQHYAKCKNQLREHCQTVLS